MNHRRLPAAAGLRWLTTVLLAGTCLGAATVDGAWADGGDGGSFGAREGVGLGGRGGADSTTGAGGNGNDGFGFLHGDVTGGGGGGGGAGTTQGGRGGLGSSFDDGAGGMGGTAGLFSVGGVSTTSRVSGSRGEDGAGSRRFIAGGGGGGGGYGAIVSSGTYTITGSGSAIGGDGGNGGTSSKAAGSGGTGGVGVFLGGGATLDNAGTIIGGAGGAVGRDDPFTTTVAAGGAGVVGSGITIINSGAITGGLSGDGRTQANAITFTGGANKLTLQAGSTIVGNIAVTGSLELSQPTAATLSNAVSGTGSVSKTGAGILILTGANSYSGGTTVSGGVLQGNATSLQGNIVNNASVVFNQTGTGTYAGTMSGTGTLAVQGGGTLTVTTLVIATGGTTVDASKLVVNGILGSPLSLINGGVLGGTGFVGTLTAIGGKLEPGNSIGTLGVTGSFTQTGGSYVVEENSAGQSDKINVGGTATLNGGTVAVVAQPGTYARTTTYTLLTANGGVAGTYSGVAGDCAFLTPALSYDASNVYLTITRSFAAGAQTSNQYAVGTALDQANATAGGSFGATLDAVTVLGTQQGPWVLNQISGQPYANFGTVNVQATSLFMNAVGQQLSGQRGGTMGGPMGGAGARLAVAEACTTEACDAAAGPWSVWASGLGGFGSVLGNANSSTLTYNFIGAAAGIDYRLDPRFLAGLAVGYSNGSQWVDSFSGKGWSNAISVAAYGSFTQQGFYADALAGYAYSNNQMQRQLTIPGLQALTANGSTGANQLLGQIETGYRLPVFTPMALALTPFARLQASTVNQAAFSEWGANALSLNVAQQTTNSLRTTFGADLASSFEYASGRSLELALRVGWLHEFADTGRPITAAFAAAPANAFTVHGATPQRDSAVIGLQANSWVAEATQLYFRYDGELGPGSDNHAFNVGLRLRW